VNKSRQIAAVDRLRNSPALDVSFLNAAAIIRAGKYPDAEINADPGIYLKFMLKKVTPF